MISKNEIDEMIKKEIDKIITRKEDLKNWKRNNEPDNIICIKQENTSSSNHKK